MADKDNFDKLQREVMETLQKMMKGAQPAETAPGRAQDDSEKETENKREKNLNFDLKPKQIKKYLDRFVIKQEEAKRVLATAVCDHYNHVKAYEEKKKKGEKDYYFKQNIIMLGPTGVGKTHLIRHLAELVGVPFVKADATKFSETGYVGGDVEDLIRELVTKAEDDIELAQYGIIYLDEIDKIASPLNNGNRDVSGSGVQRGLLKIMEETDVSLRNPQDIQAQLQGMMEFQKKGKMTKPKINTRHILFIVSGSFDGILPIIEKRLSTKEIGFSKTKKGNDPSQTTLLSEVQTSDFQEFGYESEFIGRLPVRVTCHPLHEEDLHTILSNSEDSILKQYISAFKSYGIEMKTQEKALWEISKLAAKEGTGARGLFTVLERVFRDLKYELPSSHLKEFGLTADMVKNPKSVLKELLKEEHQEQINEITEIIHAFEKKYREANKIEILFDEEALKSLQNKIIEEGLETEPFLSQLLANYKYGLELIQKKTSQQKFVLPKEIVNNPNGVLDKWIKETYENN